MTDDTRAAPPTASTAPEFTLATVDQIFAHIEEIAGDDFLGFAGEVLIPYLPFDMGSQFLADPLVAPPLEAPPLERQDVLAAMADYLNFAWGKALGHRGISASRSVSKLTAYLFILGDGKAVDFSAACPFAQYGAPFLRYVSLRYSLPVPSDPAAERMAAGERCSPGCDEGCV